MIFIWILVAIAAALLAIKLVGLGCGMWIYYHDLTPDQRRRHRKAWRQAEARYRARRRIQ